MFRISSWARPVQTFSTKTLNATLVIGAAGLIMWALKRKPQEWVEWITAAHCIIFLTALAYVTLVSFSYTQGLAQGPSPWYSSVLLPPMLGLAFLGCSRAGSPG